jgi:AraC-like DNA-binding protein
MLPIILLYFNKGYFSANRYLAGFLFFASLYLLENFYFLYGESLSITILFTFVHSFFYLIGPFAFFYVRSILRDNSKLSRVDYLHFGLFTISFIGYIPYFFSSWDFKAIVAQNLQSENWDITSFRLNKFLFHEVDQALNVLHTYFYTISLWYLFWHYKNSIKRSTLNIKQYKLITNWLLVFVSIFTLITINFTVAIAGVWIYNEKSIFLERMSICLLLASLIYIGMNMTILFYPRILYGLQIELKSIPMLGGIVKKQETNPIELLEADFLNQEDDQLKSEKTELKLFTDEYKEIIEVALENYIGEKVFLNSAFRLIHFSSASGVPMHHLTYYFNNLKKISFTVWRNNLRIGYAKELILQVKTNNLTLEAISLKSGFASQSTFIRAFKNVTGNTPSSYFKSIS